MFYRIKKTFVTQHIGKQIAFGALLFLLVILSACSSQKKLIQKQNQALLYQPSSTLIRPEYIVYHTNDTISQLNIKLDISELIFNLANTENKLLASVKISYLLTNIDSENPNKAIADSATFVRSIEKHAGKNIIVLSLQIKARINNYYNLKVTITDQIREIGNTAYLVVNKKNTNSPQYLKIYYAENDAPVFKNYLTVSDSFKIQTTKPVQKIYIKYQRDNLALPPPPFSSITEPVFTFQPDSVWALDYHIYTTYKLPYNGLYIIQTDTLAPEGYYIANFGNTYPHVKDIKTMLQPLEYITTTEEFRKLSENDSMKLAIDNFWYKLSGNADVSRELIRVYYNRIQYANQYFTSYKPGWKTDRGMIYIIFGPPSYVKKTESFETWEYYVKQEATNLKINFIKNETSYSDNHFIMQRSNTFTSFWREAVSSWRRGIAYSLEE